MKKYYIEINGQQSGPLDLENLKTKNISKETMVWYEGLDDWTKAEKVKELQSIFKSIPPPLRKAVPPPIQKVDPIYVQSIYNTEPIPENTSFLSTTLNKVFIGGFALIVCAVLLFSFADKTQADVQTKTEQNTEALQQQQQLLDEQAAKIAEQERLEAERKERERKAAIKERMDQISEQLKLSHQNLEIAKRQLNDATAFQLLRSTSERNRDINAANENVAVYVGEIESLEREMRDLKASY